MGGKGRFYLEIIRKKIKGKYPIKNFQYSISNQDSKFLF